MSAATVAPPEAPPQAIRIDPAAVYPQAALAELLNVTERQIRRWRKVRRDGRPWFPRPFLQGRVPCWTGEAIVEWQRQQQAKALKPAVAGKGKD